MKPITVYIVEDEPPARERLLAFVDAHPQLKSVGWSETGKKALEEIPRILPDVVLLDIHLPDISGLDVLKLLPEKPQVIFSTAYDQYALQAFELNAVDYLLKPYSYERFERAIEKLKTRTLTPPDLTDATRGVRLQQTLQRIPARVGERIYILAVDDIVYFASEDKVVLAHLVDKAYIINYTLEELEQRLDPEQFFRIHRSTIVNLNFVHIIEPYFGGSYIMEVKDNRRTQLPISRNAARRLRKKLGW
ncbi:MAG: response regulator transcription factor [Calditrichaeota bacterium]|nr:response regulator transcription factor [Calditrichota bacterium]